MSSHPAPNLSVKNEWIEALKLGDKVAFAKIVRVWESAMLQTATRILGSVAEAEEVRQNVLLKMYEAPATIPHADRFAPWIRRCVINESLRKIRRQSIEERYRQQTSLGTKQQLDSSDPATIAMRRDLATSLHQAMAGLTPHQRTLLTLRFDDELTIREIAEVLESAKTTVHAQLAEAIVFLRRKMSD